MDNDKVKAALEALRVLADSEASAGTPTGWRHAKELCAHGENVARMATAPRVADELENGDADFAMAEIGVGGDYGAYQRVRRAGPRLGVDMGLVDVLREMLAAQQAQAAPRPERVLNDLLDVRRGYVDQQLPVPPELQARLDRALAAVATADAPAALEPPAPVIDVARTLGAVALDGEIFGEEAVR